MGRGAFVWMFLDRESEPRPTWSCTSQGPGRHPRSSHLSTPLSSQISAILNECRERDWLVNGQVLATVFFRCGLKGCEQGVWTAGEQEGSSGTSCGTYAYAMSMITL